MKSFRICTILCGLVFTLGVLAAWPHSALGNGQVEKEGVAGSSHVPSVDDQIKNLTEKLNLTDEQQSRIKPILEDQRQQVQAQMKSPYLSPEDNRSALRRIQVTANTKIRELLTDEQKTKFDQMEKERRDRSTRENHKGNESSQ